MQAWISVDIHLSCFGRTLLRYVRLMSKISRLSSVTLVHQPPYLRSQRTLNFSSIFLHRVIPYETLMPKMTTNVRRSHLHRGVNPSNSGVVKNRDFWSISCFISETIQDRATHTMVPEQELVHHLSNGTISNDLSNPNFKVTPTFGLSSSVICLPYIVFKIQRFTGWKSPLFPPFYPLSVVWRPRN